MARGSREPIARVVALGASNLTRGFHALVDASRRRWGPEVEILAALGHGRSYGSPSTFLVRTLPGILQSGLWAELSRRPGLPTRALVTDVGNDILYGAPVPRILQWIDDCVARLQCHTADIVLTDLPLFTIHRLSPAKFLVFRSLFFPSCRLSLAEIAVAAEQVAEGLAALAQRRGIRVCPLKSAWYGVDPIHIRPSMWRSAWAHILLPEGGDAVASRSSLWEGVQLYFQAPERREILGVERVASQAGRRLRRGGRVWLY